MKLFYFGIVFLNAEELGKHVANETDLSDYYFYDEYGSMERGKKKKYKPTSKLQYLF